MLTKLTLEVRYVLSLITVILLVIIVICIIPVSSAYISDKHSIVVNLLVLLFTVVVIERLSSHKSILDARRADAQRILGFDKILRIYLSRYIQFADAMTLPEGSYLGKPHSIRDISTIDFSDLQNMYNIALFKNIPLNTKCYNLYFEASIELGEIINHNLAYIYSTHYQEILDIMLELAEVNNKLDRQSMYDTFKKREHGYPGGEPMAQHDINFFKFWQTGATNKSVEDILNGYGLSEYAMTYTLLKRDLLLINKYKNALAIIKTQYGQANDDTYEQHFLGHAFAGQVTIHLGSEPSKE